MKIIVLMAFMLVFCGMAFSQDNLSKDRDYQNFKRNYEKAIKYFNDVKNKTGKRAEINAERYAKYARKFLNKLKKKYEGAMFSSQESKLIEVESYFNKKENIANESKLDFEYFKLWQYRLKPNSLNSSNINSNLKDFDKTKLLRVYSKIINTGKFKRLYSVEDIENFEMALNDFEALLGKTNIFHNTKGIIGIPLDNSKRIQDKDYYLQNLSIAKQAVESLLIVSPNSKLLNSKRNEINSLIANADLQIKKNKPKLVKKYKDSLPKAVIKNSKLEQEFVDAIRFQKYPGVKIISGIITSSNWSLQKSANGRSLYRWREGVVTAKTAEGDCWFQYYNFRQPYTGSGFGKTIRGSTGERFYIKCSNL